MNANSAWMMGVRGSSDPEVIEVIDDAPDDGFNILTKVQYATYFIDPPVQLSVQSRSPIKTILTLVNHGTAHHQFSTSTGTDRLGV